jgi:dienelactone hydrolase
VFGGDAVVRLELRPEADAAAGMVWVPAAASPVLPSLALPGFWIDRYEVTNEQFKRFVDDGGYQKPQYWRQPFVKDGRTLSFSEATAEFRDLAGRPGPAGWQLGSYPESRGEEPVTGVSWYEAAAYAEFVGKSLPTVHEWRQEAPVTVNSNILALSNFSGSAPARVKAHLGVSRFGAYDMAGNVKEWAWNAADVRRYTLGGAWNEPSYTYYSPDLAPPFARDASIGFRCVRRVEAPPVASLDPLPPPPAPVPRGEPASEEAYRAYLGQHAYERTELEARLERSDETSPFHRRETVSFRAAYGEERVIAHLFLPRNAAPPYQVVAVMGGVTIINQIRRIEDFDYPFEFIVRSGRAVVIPAFAGTLERGPSELSVPAHQERERSIRWSMDLGRTFDYLETRSDVDARKLAFYGLSRGACVGVRLTAVEPRIKAAVLSTGGLMPSRSPETDSWNFAPHVRVPVLMVNGRHDAIFPLETNQKPLFQALGTRQKKHVLYDGGHRNLVTRPDLIGEILDFLDLYLGPVEMAR